MADSVPPPTTDHQLNNGEIPVHPNPGSWRECVYELAHATELSYGEAEDWMEDRRDACGKATTVALRKWTEANNE